MSGSVTPARRRRSTDDEEEEEDDISVDGEATPQSRTNKRARISNGGPVLPQSYLRSPNGRASGSDDMAIEPHQPGSLVRVTMTNFVTYEKAEFVLGPNLNMIIGPNGTGKSTLVCAICLGLGWETKHLGRAKDISEFVKHGAKKATIEIELAKDPKRQTSNPVIRTKILRENNKVEYYINDKKENKKRVMDLARSFSIQVDNLCQFLPQDRVVEFAALSPVELLAQTQRAAAPEQMTEWHQQLKEMRKQQKLDEDSKARLTDDLGRLENRQRMQHGDVERLRERTELQERLGAYRKFKPFPAYKVAKQNHTEAKLRRKEAEKELRRLNNEMAPRLECMQEKEHYLEVTEKTVQQRQRLVGRYEGTSADLYQQLEKKAAELEQIDGELQSGNTSIRQTKQKIPELNRAVTSIKAAMEQPPEQVDTAAFNEQIREKAREMRDLDDKINESKDQITTLNQQGRQRQTIIKNTEQEMAYLQSQAGQQTDKLRKNSRFGHAAVAWEWIQKNKDRFKGKVFGPPILECSIKDSRLAAAVETTISQSELMAFSVTCREDFTLLQRELYTNMKLVDINIRSAPPVALSSFKPPCSPQQMTSYGLEGWILDLLEGPDEVLAMLCDNRNIHATAFTSRDVPADQHDNLSRSPISSWVTSTQSYQVTRRREYGDHATSTRVTALRPPKFFTDAPVDHREEEEFTRKIRETEVEMEEIKEQITKLREEEKTYVERQRELSASKKAIEKEKNEKQSALAHFQGLPIKLAGAQKKLDDAQMQIRKHRDSQLAIVARGDKIALEKGQLALNYGNSVEALRGLHVQLFEAEIMKIEAQSDLTQLKARHEEERAMLAEAQAAVEAHARIVAEFLAEGRRLMELCQQFTEEDLTANEINILEEVKEMAPEDLETNIEATQARLEMTAGGNAGIIAEFEERGRKIERDRAKLEEIETNLEQLQSSITEIKDQWEPELDALVAQISEAFGENFAKIQCAGEVGVHKDDDFEQWAIQIRVKFRYVKTQFLLQPFSRQLTVF
jgi:chromosome segregation ATPase